MVIKEDGTKWACQSCLKGHRVSGCTHKDRELTLVPKKGRPVTQCAHCRHERKKRSAHVKCDCGETEKPHHSKEKCIHLREAEQRSNSGLLGHPFEDQDSAHLFAVAEEQGCCCHHGGNCTCAVLRKDFEKSSGSTPLNGSTVNPHLEASVSDGSITVFQNGHHKPVHRKNHMAHESGMPYKMPIKRNCAEHSVAKAARRSVDSLALDNNLTFNPSPFAFQMGKPSAPTRRMSRSEQPSPDIQASSTLDDPNMPDIDLDNLGPSIRNQSFQSEGYDFSSDPMSGLADNAYDRWLPEEDFTSMPNNNPFGVWPTNENHHALAQPALTAASSGTQSEIDDFPPMDDVYGFGMPSVQEAADDSTVDNFAQGSPQSNRRSLPADFFSAATYAVPNTDSEWMTSAEDFTTNNSIKSKQFDEPEQMEFDGPWQTSPAMTSSQRPIAGLPPYRRTTSQSVGAMAAPADDLMQQLFPGIDVTGAALALSPNFDGKSQTTALGSSSADFISLDDTAAFTSQPWSDGSLSIPNDPFPSPYDMDGDFSPADFPSWSQ